MSVVISGIVDLDVGFMEKVVIFWRVYAMKECMLDSLGRFLGKVLNIKDKHRKWIGVLEQFHYL